MPNLHPIGFWIPALLAAIFVRGFYKHVTRNQFIQIFLQLTIAATLSYLFRTDLKNGIQMWPFYILIPIGYFFFWIHFSPAPGKYFPMAAICSLGFILQAIADGIATSQRYGAAGWVGGAGWHDGLVLFFLFPFPSLIVSILLGAIAEFSNAKDTKTSFSWIESLKFHACLIRRQTSKS